MICIIRIKGETGIKKEFRETLARLRLRKKYSCVVISPKKEQEGMIKKIRNLVAYGEIEKGVFKMLLEKRGQVIDKKKKMDFEKISEEIKKGKRYEDMNLKPFFRLHPPRGGIDSKINFGKGKGVLGNNGDKINELVKKMI